jgi:hypothetical protein
LRNLRTLKNESIAGMTDDTMVRIDNNKRNGRDIRKKEVVIRNNLRKLGIPMLRLADGIYLLQISELENAIKKAL